MDEVNNLKENSTKETRSFYPNLDLTPLEHVLVGSSVVVGGIFINSNSLRDPEIAVNRALLLKPSGLTNAETTMEEVISGRKKKEDKRMWPACLTGPLELMIHGYEFIYDCAPLDSNGKIPNLFRFRITHANHEWSPSKEEDLEALRKIELAHALSANGDKSSLFTLNKDESMGTLSLTFLPLQKKML